MAAWKKIFFLHIPKTAGSAFNQMFKPCMPQGRYFEHMESRRELVKKITDDGEPFFLSGHLPYFSARAIVERADIVSITIVRNPWDQFVSHIKWLKFVGSPVFPTKDKILPSIMELSRALYDVPLHDMPSIIRTIDTAIGHRLLDNLQVRHLMSKSSDGVSAADAAQATINMNKFTLAFALDDMDWAWRQLRAQLPALAPITRHNEARIDGEIDLRNAESNAIILPWIVHDLTLYDAVRQHSGRISAAA